MNYDQLPLMTSWRQISLQAGLVLLTLLLPATTDAQSYFKTGTVYLVQSSHHDLGWHKDTYEGESRFTIQEIDRALDMMNEDPDFTFCGEYVIWLYDYVQKRPDRVPELTKRFKEGRMEWGAGYTQPYTTLLTSEQLARQMLYGVKWFRDTFDCDADVYYNTDIPGFTRQMPQILKKSGVPKAYLSRSDNLTTVGTDLLTWTAPDGSDIFCYFMGFYVQEVERIKREFVPRYLRDPERMHKWITDKDKDYRTRNIPNNLIHFLCMDCRMPSHYRKEMDSWNDYAKQNGLPPVQYSTLSKAIDATYSADATYKQLTGEWPCRWLYEAAPSNAKLTRDQRDSARLLRAAESFRIFAGSVDTSMAPYPNEAFDDAWRKAIKSCHGYAPAQVVAMYKKIYREARDTAVRELDTSLRAITEQVDTLTSKRLHPVILYNTLSWNRPHDVVELTIPEELTPPILVARQNKKGKLERVSHQQTSTGAILVQVNDTPSFGYQTLYLASGKSPAPTPRHTPDTAWTKPFRTTHFTISPTSGGIASIIDRTLKSPANPQGTELLKTNHYAGAEWFDTIYKGQGAGGHKHISFPDHRDIDRLSSYTQFWHCVESGPIRTVFTTSPANTPRGKISLTLTAYEQIKRIDLTCTIKEADEEPARQIRMAFPINVGEENVSRGRIVYEAPFGVVEVGKDDLEPGLAYGRHSMRPRETQNWIYAGDEHNGVTISSDVVAWDYALLDGKRPSAEWSPVLQPVLLTSAASCHRKMGHWTQPGDHQFSFSIFSHKAGWQHGYRDALQARNPLIAVLKTNTTGSLPSTHSFLSISEPGVIITTVKKAQDSDATILRLYEAEGQSRPATSLRVHTPIKKAAHVSLIETPTGKAISTSTRELSLDLSPWSIETLSIETGKSP